MRGKAQVAQTWKRYYDAAPAPFSWEPDRVEVLDSGGLAMTSGPVHDPSGQRVGTFNSVWRREKDGRLTHHFRHRLPAVRRRTLAHPDRCANREARLVAGVAQQHHRVGRAPRR